MRLFTIGFTKKPAETFFTRLKSAGVQRLVDVRLNNVSQLAGFAKRDDLRFFTRALCGIDYVHLQSLAPTQEMLDEYKKRQGSWELYEKRFLDLMRSRAIENSAKEVLDGSCLLCSEEKPHHCHRRLVAEYLRERWEGVEIQHIP
jgi:uncharacterized protein (DUF488 family)